MKKLLAFVLTLLVSSGAVAAYECNGLPTAVDAGVAVTANTAQAIPLPLNSCVAVECNVDTNIFVAAVDGGASANGFSLKANTIWVFYDQTQAFLNVYPASTGTCSISVIGS